MVHQFRVEDFVAVECSGCSFVVADGGDFLENGFDLFGCVELEYLYAIGLLSQEWEEAEEVSCLNFHVHVLLLHGDVLFPAHSDDGVGGDVDGRCEHEVCYFHQECLVAS